MTIGNARPEPSELSLTLAVASAAVFFVATLCACGPPDVGVEKLPTPPEVGSTDFEHTVPGLPGVAYEHPTELEIAVCPEPQPNIIIWGGVAVNGQAPPAPKIRRADGPTNNQLVAFWTVCNQGQAAQPPGETYTLTTSLRTTDRDFPPGAPGFLTETPFADARSPVLPIPALAKCSCFVQEVGINMDVPPGAANQSTLMGLAPSFPRINLTAMPPIPAENQTFQYVEKLPVAFGTQEMVFEIL